MSSSTERKSPLNFIVKAQEDLTVAETAHPCVAVTEPNWTAMISTQRAQIELLKNIQNTLPTLTTDKEEKFSRKCGNPIEIHYTFQPKPRTTSKTAVSTIAMIPMELQMTAITA